MRILIFGGDGMLGHQLLQSWQHHQVFVTLRQSLATYRHYQLFNRSNSIADIDVRDLMAVEKTIAHLQPDVVVNAVGIIKQRDAANDAVLSIEINALFPHKLYQICQKYTARLIHLSTDCVFSGLKGLYSEKDIEDGRDLYGRSKLLGEVKEKGAFTLRTSIIGLELARKQSLIEWFLAQSGVIKGFTGAVYSGITTLEMARVIDTILQKHQQLNGVWHVASEPINKYDLLMMLNEKLARNDVIIEADNSFVCDRSLDGSKFHQETGYMIPSWSVMLRELALKIKE